MPRFAIAGAPDDDIWSIVAFLKKLPSVSYQRWTTSLGSQRRLQANRSSQRLAVAKADGRCPLKRHLIFRTHKITPFAEEGFNSPLC